MIYLETLIFRLLAQMCATQPHTLDDVEAYVQRNFASPIDAWALSDAKVIMDRSQRRKGVFSFPVEKIYYQLQKVHVVCEYSVGFRASFRGGGRGGTRPRLINSRPPLYYHTHKVKKSPNVNNNYDIKYSKYSA